MPLSLLVVDDEPDVELLMRQRFRRRIRSGELSLAFAGDGVEALAVLEENPDIHLVLSDINMPRMDGLTLLGHIQDLNRMLKVIIVSAYGDMDNIRTAMNRGAFDFVTKPIDFEDLVITIDKTAREIEAYRAAQASQHQLQALRRDLEIASEIQLSALPSTFPAFPDHSTFDLYATMIPAQTVGGDFYDFFLIDDERLGFVIADVSGKGLSAAMFMLMARTLLRATALQGLAPGDCLRHVNRALYPESMKRMFVTLVYGTLHLTTGTVTYANAGHNLPYVLRRDGTVATLPRTGGIGLCLMRDFAYNDATVQLAPGDGLYLFTDGITEAVNAAHDLFDDERLLPCLHQAYNADPKALIAAVRTAVTAFVDGAPQSDDMTMLALQYLGP